MVRPTRKAAYNTLATAENTNTSMLVTKHSRRRRTGKLMSVIDSAQRFAPGIGHTAVPNARFGPPKAGNTTLSHVKPAKGAPTVVSTRPLLGVRVLDLPASRERLQIRRVLHHPLSKGFDDATTSYGEELQNVANQALGEQYDNLLTRLNGENDNSAEALEADQMLADAIEAATLDAQPFADETITLKPEYNAAPETYTIGERIEQFKGVMKAEEIKIAKLAEKYDVVLSEIAEFVVNKLESGTGQLSDDEQIKGYREKFELEIEELGEDELQELEEEKKRDKVKRKKLLEALQRL